MFFDVRRGGAHVPRFCRPGRLPDRNVRRIRSQPRGQDRPAEQQHAQLGSGLFRRRDFGHGHRPDLAGLFRSGDRPHHPALRGESLGRFRQTLYESIQGSYRTATGRNPLDEPRGHILPFGRSARNDQGSERGRPRRHHLYFRNDFPAQRGHAVAQKPLQRTGDGQHPATGLPKRRLPVDPAAVAHLRMLAGHVAAVHVGSLGDLSRQSAHRRRTAADPQRGTADYHAERTADYRENIQKQNPAPTVGQPPDAVAVSERVGPQMAAPHSGQKTDETIRRPHPLFRDRRGKTRRNRRALPVRREISVRDRGWTT